MYKLYYHTICPFSRLTKILLKEKKLEDLEVINVNFWERQEELRTLNPAGELPNFEYENGKTVWGRVSLLLFIERNFSINHDLLPEELNQYNELYTKLEWFMYKFYNEVTRVFVHERILTSYKHQMANQNALKVARKNLDGHMKYNDHLLRDAKWLGGEKLTLVDFALAAQISLIDYLGEIMWTEYDAVKDWYSLMKSRPSFQSILKESIAGFKPEAHYQLLDF